MATELEKAPYMPNKPSFENETKVCLTCKHFHKVEVTLVGKSDTNSKGESRFRWQNEKDGNWHIKKVGDNFEHQLPKEGEKPQTTVTLTEAEKAYFEKNGVLDLDTMYHNGARYQVQQQGSDPDAGNIVAFKELTLAMLRRPAEIVGNAYSSQVLADVRGASIGSFHLPTAVKGLDVSKTVDQGVAKLLINFPFFLKYKTPSTIKLFYFYKFVLGYEKINDLERSTIYPESILRKFREKLPSELKHWSKEKFYREYYTPQ